MFSKYKEERRERDLEAVQASYPFLVKVTGNIQLTLDICDWIVPICDDILVVDRYSIGPAINFPPWTVTYGFKKEEDALAFRIKFGKYLST